MHGLGELCGVANGVDERIEKKVFSVGLDTLKEWGMIRLPRGCMCG